MSHDGCNPVNRDGKCSGHIGRRNAVPRYPARSHAGLPSRLSSRIHAAGTRPILFRDGPFSDKINHIPDGTYANQTDTVHRGKMARHTCGRIQV